MIRSNFHKVIKWYYSLVQTRDQPQRDVESWPVGCSSGTLSSPQSNCGTPKGARLRGTNSPQRSHLKATYL